MSRSRKLLVLAALAAAMTSPAGAATQEEIKEMLEKRFGVEVLRMRETEVDGRAAIAATVMNRGGNSNAAFQVNTLVVDKETGNLVPQFRHLPSGYSVGGGGPNDPLEDTGERSRRLLNQTR